MSITLLIRDARWRKVRGLPTKIRRAVTETLREAEARAEADLTVLLTTDRHMRTLNRDFRRKDKATNVLSFPAEADGYLGDVAIAYGTTAKEAKLAGKLLRDHAVHLAVHGVLHLLGFDHVNARQAAVMEPKEVRVLKRLAISDPYRETA